VCERIGFAQLALWPGIVNANGALCRIDHEHDLRTGAPVDADLVSDVYRTVAGRQDLDDYVRASRDS